MDDAFTRRLLGVSRPDPGCDHALEVVDLFVELELAGGSPELAFPEVVAHFESCSDCREDHEGIRELARAETAGER
jgi:hypothetical protein